MDERVRKIIDEQVKYWGLEHYVVGTSRIYKEQDQLGKISYQLNIEFYPQDAKLLYEDGEVIENPAGTVSIDYNIQTKEVVNYITVLETTFATKQVFQEKTVEEVAKWVEQQVGLEYGKHFIAVEGSSNHYSFVGALHHIVTREQMAIEVEFDDEGRLLHFSRDGKIQEEALIEKNEFTLTLEGIEPIVQNQLKLIHYPVESEERFIPLYVIDEVFIENEGGKPYPSSEYDRHAKSLHRVIEWSDITPIELIREPIEVLNDILAEEAFSATGNEEVERLSAEEIEQMAALVTRVIATVLPKDSGKWALRHAQLMDQYIEARVELVEESHTIFKRKFIVLIERETMALKNYLDNGEILSIFDEFEKAASPVVTKEEAFERLLPAITLEPYYSYNVAANTYELCGLLDADEAVHALTGELISMSELE